MNASEIKEKGQMEVKTIAVAASGIIAQFQYGGE